ncbi:hypothetical protein [Streptomyces griseosporeus]
MGRDTAADAAQALRLLNRPEMRHHPATGPSERHTGSTTPGTPLNLAIVDYLTDHVGEIVDHMRNLTDGPVTVPDRVETIYERYVEATAGADEADRLHRDMLIERHRLEHAIRLGEHDEVCKEPCPRCGCWGLMWEHAAKKALCSNRRCRTPEGLASRWTLARLAAQKVQRTEIWRRTAT